MENVSSFLKNRLASFHARWLSSWRSCFRFVGAFALRCSLILSFLLPNFLPLSALAADQGVTGTLNGYYVTTGRGSGSASSVNHQFIYGQQLPLINSTVDYAMIEEEQDAYGCSVSLFNVSVPSVSGAVGIYFSYFYTGAGNYAWASAGAPDLVQVFGYDSSGVYNGYVFTREMVTFSPSSSAPYKSNGFRYSCRSVEDIPEDNYVNSFELAFNPNAFSWYLTNGSSSSSRVGALSVPSFRVIAVASSAELDALEGIADQIANQSAVLSAMYGDIMAILNSIYSRCGDIQQTAQLANQYLSQIVTLLTSLNSTTSEIYTLLQSQFSLLIETINSGVVSITDAISQAELRLEAYFKPVIDYFNSLEETTGESASTLPGHKTDLDNAVSKNSGLDEDALNGFSSVWSMISGFEMLLIIIGIWLGAGIMVIIIKKGLS